MGVCEGQRLGAVFFLIAFLVAYGASLFTHQRPVSQLYLPWGEQSTATLAVEIATGGKGDGVYFVSEKEGLSKIFHKVDILDKIQFSDFYQKLLSTGYAITISEDRGMVSVADMSVIKRLAIGLPIDVNSASVGELSMVPGIGSSMAIRIVQLRQSKVKLKALTDLKQVTGIKEYRLRSLSQYLRVSELHR